jgi:trimeric autotransporter adhesin
MFAFTASLQQQHSELDSDSSTEAKILAVQALEVAAELRTRVCAPDNANRLETRPLVAVAEAVKTECRASSTGTTCATTAAVHDNDGLVTGAVSDNNRSLLSGPLFLQLHPQLQLLLEQKQSKTAQAARVRHSVALTSLLLSQQQQEATATTATATGTAIGSARLQSNSVANSAADSTRNSTTVRSCCSGAAMPRVSIERKPTVITVTSSICEGTSSDTFDATTTVIDTATASATTAGTADAVTVTATSSSDSLTAVAQSSIATPRVSAIRKPAINNSTSIDSQRAVLTTAAATGDKTAAAVSDSSSSSSLVTPRVSILRRPADDTTSSSSTTANTTVTTGVTATCSGSNSSCEKGSLLSPQRPSRFRPSFGSHRGVSPSPQLQPVEQLVVIVPSSTTEHDINAAATEAQATDAANNDSSSSDTTDLVQQVAAKPLAAVLADMWPALKRQTFSSTDSTAAIAAAAATAAATAAAATAATGRSSGIASPLRTSALGLNTRRTLLCHDNNVPGQPLRYSLAAVSDALIAACSTAAMAGSSTSDSAYAISSGAVQFEQDSDVRSAALVQSEHTMLFDNKGTVDTTIALSSQQIGAVVASSADLMTDALLDKLQSMSSKGGGNSSSGTGGSSSSGRKSLKPVTIATAGRRKGPPALFKVQEDASTASKQ